MTSVGVGALSENKPLRWSFLVTFSIVVCSIWAVVWTLARVEHARLVTELSRRVAGAPEEEAALALRQLTQLREPPVETIVVAATSPAREVALQAQESVLDLLRKWQHESATERGAAHVAARLERLANALEAERDNFASLDFPWVERATEKMLRLANAAPPDDLLCFAGNCESLLALSHDRSRQSRLEIVPVANAMLKSAPIALFAPPSRVALQSIAAAETPSVLDDADPPPAPPAISNDTVPMPRPFHQPAEESLKPTSSPTAKDAPVDDTARDPWVQWKSRELLERWLVENGPRQEEISRELRQRGFGSLRSDIVRLALVGSTTMRVQLVHDLPAIPGVGAKAWLMLLAEDADAEVRLTAVSVMATSSDVELLERAWNVALHDRDPRIAGLAERLRDRRTATRQR